MFIDDNWYFYNGVMRYNIYDSIFRLKTDFRNKH